MTSPTDKHQQTPNMSQDMNDDPDQQPPHMQERGGEAVSETTEKEDIFQNIDLGEDEIIADEDVAVMDENVGVIEDDTTSDTKE